jgi:hypothetical protein
LTSLFKAVNKKIGGTHIALSLAGLKIPDGVLKILVVTIQLEMHEN